MRGTKLYAMLAAMFMAGAFLASPELRAYAANTIGSTDIIDGQVKTADLANNAVTATKIKDGEVKAADIAANAVGSSEIATDAVGAAELQGVTKLLFGQCVLGNTEATSTRSSGATMSIVCDISGVDSDDSAVATFDGGTICYEVQSTSPNSGYVGVTIRNDCPFTAAPGAGSMIAVIVYDK